MQNKCVFIIGPESTGSKLIARVCAHVLSIADFEEWNGSAWCDNGKHKVCHRSLPYNIPPTFPDIEKWIAENQKEYHLSFILTTRDVTISHLSRASRWKKTIEQCSVETKEAKKIMTQVIKGKHPHFIWSYETFMFLGLIYLKQLYGFLEIESDFLPDLKDGNNPRISIREGRRGARSV